MFRKFGIFAIIVIAFVVLVKFIRLSFTCIIVLADFIAKLATQLFTTSSK